MATYQRKTGRRKRTAPRPLPNLTDWGELTTLCGLRRQAVRLKNGSCRFVIVGLRNKQSFRRLALRVIWAKSWPATYP